MAKGLILKAQPSDGGMIIYVTGRGMGKIYVMAHRHNQDLFHYLRDGRRLDDVRSYKPGRGFAQQKLARSLQHVLKVTDWILAESAAA